MLYLPHENSYLPLKLILSSYLVLKTVFVTSCATIVVPKEFTKQERKSSISALLRRLILSNLTNFVQHKTYFRGTDVRI